MLHKQQDNLYNQLYLFNSKTVACVMYKTHSWSFSFSPHGRTLEFKGFSSQYFPWLEFYITMHVGLEWRIVINYQLHPLTNVCFLDYRIHNMIRIRWVSLDGLVVRNNYPFTLWFIQEESPSLPRGETHRIHVVTARSPPVLNRTPQVIHELCLVGLGISFGGPRTRNAYNIYIHLNS